MMEIVQKPKDMSLKGDICRMLHQVRWQGLKISGFKPAFYPELISFNHILSNCKAISVQLTGLLSQSAKCFLY